MYGKYLPLEKYLSALPASTRQITLRFDQTEEILSVRLAAIVYIEG